MKGFVKIIAFIVALVALYNFIVFRVLLRRGLALVDSTVPFSRALPNASTRILIAGDSTAYGTGAAKPEESVAGLIGAHYPDAEIVNSGRNHARTKDTIEQIRSLRGQKFDLVFIMIGGNDITHLTPKAELQRDATTLITEAQELAPHVLMVTTGNVQAQRPIPFGVRRLVMNESRRVRTIFETISRERGVTWVNLYPDNYDPLFSDIRNNYAADMYHPSSAGYALWFQVIQPYLPAL